MVGWSNVSVHIIEFCSETQLDIRENYYIEKYLPTLNRKFSSLYSRKTYRSLSGLLFQRQTLNRSARFSGAWLIKFVYRGFASVTVRKKL